MLIGPPLSWLHHSENHRQHLPVKESNPLQVFEKRDMLLQWPGLGTSGEAVGTNCEDTLAWGAAEGCYGQQRPQASHRDPVALAQVKTRVD